MAALKSKLLFLLTLTLLALNYNIANAAIRGKTQRKIRKINQLGPFVGIVTRSQLGLDLLLEHPSFIPLNRTLEVAGRMFRFGSICEEPFPDESNCGERVALVMTGSSLINAGITTQLLLSLFRIKGVVHYGVAGNADPSLNIGDVIIPEKWSHTGLWSWQRFGLGPENELPLEGSGDYSRKFGYLKFADYAVNVNGCEENDNLLNNIWYQQEEIFPVNGTLEERQHVFWVPVDPEYFEIAGVVELLGVDLEKCANPVRCLSTTPKVARVERGTSASIYLDNAAYRTFLHNKFKVGPVDMDSAAVALICRQQQVPFIVIKSLSDLAGAGSANSADIFTPLAAKNAVTVTVEFIITLWDSEKDPPAARSV